MIKNITALLFLLTAVNFCYADTAPDYRGPYVGVLAGIGDTNWDMLEAKDDDSTDSTPTKAKSRGADWGFLAGYQISRNFALEANYHKYKNANIYFAEFNVYNGIREMNSSTDAIGLVGKFIAPINNVVAGFAEVGASYVTRTDILTNKDEPGQTHRIGRISPTFGAGLNVNVSQHILTALEFQYTAGYDQSTETPVYEYIPFIYSVDLHVAYRF